MITCTSDRQLLDITIEMATASFVAVTGAVVVMVMVLVLFADLPGIKPSSAQ
jgi:hypothetical protein